jgi:hypothetical protein
MKDMSNIKGVEVEWITEGGSGVRVFTLMRYKPK